MSCSECSRLGRPCVTSSIARLDKVVDDLSSKIQQDEEEVQKLLDQVEEVRRRITRNKRVRDENSAKLDNQLAHSSENDPGGVDDRHVVDNLPSGSPSHPLLTDAAVLDIQLGDLGVASPFSWPKASS